MRIPELTRVKSLVQITTTKGDLIEFVMSASVGVVPNMVKEMKSTGVLTLWNDTETLCVMANLIATISVTELTKE